MKKSISTFIFIAALLGCVSIAQAQRPTSGGRPAPAGDWNISVGGGMLVKPTYEGSSDYDFWPIPYFDIRYKESFFFSPWQGIGYQTKTEDGLSYGLALGFDFGRDEEDGDILQGLDDIDFGFLANLKVGYEMGGLNWGLAYKQEMSGVHGGYELEASVSKRLFLRSWKSMLNLSLSATYANEDYLNTYFGISPAEAVRTGFSSYELDGGLKAVTVSGMLVRQINQDWSIVGIANFGRFSSDISDSPIIESENKFFGGFFFVRAL